MNVLPVFFKDFYKSDHHRQYPSNTTEVYSNLTARSSRMPGVNEVVVFGIQYFIKEYLKNRFDADFFAQDKDKVIRQYKRRMDTSLGPNRVGTDHIAALHELEYLPLQIKALPEGTLCPLRIPILTIRNTHRDFFWLTNFIETLLSNALWHPMTSATIAHEYRKLLDFYAAKTGGASEFVPWQGHDFSMRGQTSFESCMVSAGAHLLSFTGTDTIPGIDWLEQYYGADADKEMVGGSVGATEHSVMCMGGKEDEFETYRRLITEVYPDGIVSIVSDTWDYWKVLGEVLPKLKNIIMERNGKVVIRPDSGDPIKIICGNPHAPEGSMERKGTIQVLWELFGGTTTPKGYKQLNDHIGVIYGDSITFDRCKEICSRLAVKGFASTNMVYGIGSYTYQYVTRDTFGFAVKATYGVVNGQSRNLYKSPKTDDGVKCSAKGLLCVDRNSDGKLVLKEECTSEEEDSGLLRTVFKDGALIRNTDLKSIRSLLAKQRMSLADIDNLMKELQG